MLSCFSSVPHPGRTRRAALLALAAFAVAPVQAAYECTTSTASGYPYCLSIPDNTAGKLPLVVFLSGSGARGKPADVKKLSGYDGFGKLIMWYNSGNKTETTRMAATRFITIIPISPLKSAEGQAVRHWWPEKVQGVLSEVLSKHSDKTDGRCHLVGYSMGARGVWRNAIANPDLWTSLVASAGAAEAAGDPTLKEQPAPTTFDKLGTLVHKPIWQFTGTRDTPFRLASAGRTQLALEQAGKRDAWLTVLQTDHGELAHIPFDTGLMNWLLAKSAEGGRGYQERSLRGLKEPIDSGNGSTDEPGRPATGDMSAAQDPLALRLEAI